VQLRVRLLAVMSVAAVGGGLLAMAGGAAGSTAAAGAQARSHPAVGPMVRVRTLHSATTKVGAVTQVESSNWGGYAQSATAKSKFKAVKDFWKVPTVNTSASGNQFSADWVGIGGFSDQTLVQDGTEADHVNGHAQYDAWTEIIPAPEVVIKGLAIHPGDRMEGIVQETKPGTWKMTVMDLTTGKSGGRTVQYNSSGKSVEAIHERPEVNGSLANLAKTNNVSFVPGSFSTAAPGTLSWKPLLKAATGATVNEIFMVNNGGTAVIASPSAPSSKGDGFTMADGSKSPAPPQG
jgi:peptidase A4-like protein